LKPIASPETEASMKFLKQAVQAQFDSDPRELFNVIIAARSHAVPDNLEECNCPPKLGGQRCPKGGARGGSPGKPLKNALRNHPPRHRKERDDAALLT
jgi:hypothetical protein